MQKKRINFSCEKGYYSNKTGSPFCNKCPKGTFTNITGSTFCNICPKGTYSNSSNENCIYCSKVYYTNDIGS